MAKKNFSNKSEGFFFENIYHTAEEFDIIRFDRLKSSYLNASKKKDGSWPRMLAAIWNSEERLEYIFSNALLKFVLNNEKKIAKPYEVALKYGFRGFSSGKKNGIFLQRKQDGNLLIETEKLTEKYSLYIKEWVGDSFKPVKIVYHDTAGERVVGVMNFETNKAFFMDFAKY